MCSDDCHYFRHCKKLVNLNYTTLDGDKNKLVDIEVPPKNEQSIQQGHEPELYVKSDEASGYHRQTYTCTVTKHLSPIHWTTSCAKPQIRIRDKSI